MSETRTLIPMIQLEGIKELNEKELNQISEVASERGVPFHIAFIIWKTNIK